MDENLAFCLGQFIDDQVLLIDKKIDNIKADEKKEYAKLERAHAEFERKKPPAKDKGSHGDDQRLVDRFVADLRETDAVGPTRTVIDDPTRIDALRAEISTKVGACVNYVQRLRGLAANLPNTKKFVELCNDTVNYCRQTNTYEENFDKLYEVLQNTDEDNLLTNTRRWWKDSYGGRIAEINTRNQKINSPITDNGFATISPTSRIMDNGKMLLTARKVEIVASPKEGIIRRFVRQLLTLDEERRGSIAEDQLIEQLNNGSTDEAVRYARQWLNERDEVRNRKEEEDPYENALAEKKADYGRQKIAQEAKKLALAALLCRLAVGSTNDEGFDQQLKKTVQKQNDGNTETVAIISGDVKEPEVQELPIIVQLVTNAVDMEAFRTNRNNIRQRLAAGLCEALNIPVDNIRIDEVDAKRGILHLRVLPPFGRAVVDSLNGNAPDAAARMVAVRKCCIDFDAQVESFTLGEFGLQVEDRLMDPRYNKQYIWPGQTIEGGQCWAKPIDQGGKPYFCPSGWMRYGVKVSDTPEQFDAKWGTWHVAYHGTQGENASNILTSGLRVSTQGCFYETGIPRVYVSPSIEYSAHPRYAYPWKRTTKDGRTVWYQMVFQCRVNPASVDRVVQETLIHDQYKSVVTIDPNFDNNELEWIIIGKKGIQYIKDDIICYGLLMRASTVDPSTLTPSAWWKHSLHSDIYKK